MRQLQGVFLKAWAAIKPVLDAHPDELQARLSRRSSARLTRPIREWCIAVRANDRRIGPWKLPIVPEHAPASLLPHAVTLDKRALQHLCRPVVSDHYTEFHDMAQRLGLSPHALRKAIKRGQFRLHHLKRWRIREGAGRCFRDYPFVCSDDYLNPTAGWRLQTPDPLWGDFWHFFPDNLPNHFSQDIQRLPIWLPAGNQRKGICRTGNTPHSAPGTPHSGPERRERFWGWLWQCPACKNTCRLILLPVPFPPAPIFADYLAPHIQSRHEATESDTGFACAKCHNVQPTLSWPRGRSAWNEIVTRISGGLLYGHEVQILDHVKQQRKRPFTPRPQAKSPKRDQVATLLAQGQSYKQIADTLGISYITASWHAQQLMKLHNVKRKKALLQKLSQPTPHPPAGGSVPSPFGRGQG